LRRFALFSIPPRPCPNTWKAEPQKNVLSILEKIHPAKIRKVRSIFSFWGCRVKRGGGVAFVERTAQFQATTRSARAISHRYEFLIK